MVTIINKINTVHLHSLIVRAKLAAFALDLYIEKAEINTNAL
mgnify:CR=1 FL=1